MNIFAKKTDGLVVEDGVLKKYTGTSDIVRIPEGVTAIADGVFSRKNIMRVVLPEGLARIGKDCFRWCQHLEQINVPLTLKEIGEYAFIGCDKLITVGYSQKCNLILDPRTEFIPDRLFSYCRALEEVTLPQRVRAIGKEAFRHCESLTAINIPDSCELIECSAFEHCYSLEQISFNSNKVKLEGNVFGFCDALADSKGFVIFNNTLYSYCGKEECVVIPNTVHEIAPKAFCDYDSPPKNKLNSIVEIVVPNSVTIIGNKAFAYCKNLKKITISDSVRSIGHSIYYRCFRLEEVNVGENAIKELQDISQALWMVRVGKERKEIAENNARNISKVPEVVFPFANSFGGKRKSAKKIADFLIERIGENDFKNGELYVSDDRIEFKYSFECHSFFDDGGGYREFKHLILESLDESDEMIPQERDSQIKWDTVLKNPFGLKGVFGLLYSSGSDNTD